MTLNQLLDKVTIRFQDSLSLDELRDLFGYIVRNNDNIQIDYVIEQSRIISNQVPFDRVRSESVKGTVTLNLVRSAYFNCEQTQTGQFSAIRFQTIPGYELEEHSHEERMLWDSVREYVSNYFSQKY